MDGRGDGLAAGEVVRVWCRTPEGSEGGSEGEGSSGGEQGPSGGDGGSADVENIWDGDPATAAAAAKERRQNSVWTIMTDSVFGQPQEEDAEVATAAAAAAVAAAAAAATKKPAASRWGSFFRRG